MLLRYPFTRNHCKQATGVALEICLREGRTMSFSSIMRFVVDLLMPTVGSNAPSAKRRSSSTLRSSFWAFAVVLTTICGSLTADDKPTAVLLGGDAVAGWRSNGREVWKKDFSSTNIFRYNIYPTYISYPLFQSPSNFFTADLQLHRSFFVH